jgi:hypothetical protein
MDDKTEELYKTLRNTAHGIHDYLNLLSDWCMEDSSHFDKSVFQDLTEIYTAIGLFVTKERIDAHNTATSGKTA